MTSPRAHSSNPAAWRWASWLIGVAALAAVVTVSAQLSEERAFVSLVERAQPAWLLLAVALQAGTYAAQGQAWRAVLSQAGTSWPLRRAYTVSIAKLFVDQALPSLGVSGGALLARALERDRIARPLVITVVAVDTTAFYLAYAACMALALAILEVKGHATPLVIAAAALLVLLGAAVTATLARLATPSKRHATGPREPRGPLVRVAGLLRHADSRLLRDPALISRATGWQSVVALLDAGTLWCLVRAMGHPAAFSDVFAAFMLASLLRSFGFMPGGLGTFEAASVGALAAAGLPLPVALSATLLFRGLSFWLPMLPGFLISRGLGAAQRDSRVTR